MMAAGVISHMIFNCIVNELNKNENLNLTAEIIMNLLDFGLISRYFT